jgi:D-lactate dehydrogenase
MDSIEYVCDRLLPALTVNRKMGSSCDPPSLLVIKMEMAEKLVKSRGSRSEEIVLPEEVSVAVLPATVDFWCRLTASACASKAAQIRPRDCDAHCSSSRTCEIAMTRATGKTFMSYLNVLESSTCLVETEVPSPGL